MPFFAIAALFVAGFILSILFAPKPKIENAKASQLSDFQFPRSQEGDPVPRIYGTVKTKGVNTIGQCNFKAIPIKKKVKTGLFSSKKQTIGYKYQVGLDLAVTLGPCVVYRRMWYGNHLIWAGCLYADPCGENRIHIDLPELLGGQDKNGGIGGWIGLYPGSFDQTQSAYLQANLTKPNPGDQVTTYPGIAHMVFEDFYWGNSPSIEPISVEVSFFTNGLDLDAGRYVMPNGLDANPIEVLYDICINDWGMLGITDPVFNLPTWQAVADKIYTENNGVSCEIANASQGADLFKELLRQINGIIYQNPQTGLIEIVLIRKDYVVADLPVLGPAQISALRSFNKKLWEDTFNRVRIKYKNRDNSYNEAVATADDFANIRFQARVRATDIGMPMCYVSDLANELAARELSNLNVPLYQADIMCDRSNSDLVPGKCFVLNWPEYNIAGIVMRIRRMGLGNRKDGKISYTVVQDEFAADAVVNAAPSLPTTDGASYGPTDITAPSPLMVELPYWLANTAGEAITAGRTNYMTFAKKPGATSLDYFAYLNDNDPVDGDTELLANAPYSATAQLVTPIAQFAAFTTGYVTAVVIGSISNVAILKDGTSAAIQSTGAGLFMLNNELWAYETKTDNGDGTYNLNNAHRALLDTAPVASAIGDVLYFFDGQEGFWDTDVPVAAFQAYAVDRSATGRSTEAAATLFNLNPVGRQSLPLPPDYVTVGGVRSIAVEAENGTNITIDWIERNRLNASIAFETDATIAPEAATTYDVELWNTASNTMVASALAIAATTDILAVPAATATYAGLIKVYAVKGGNRSFTAALFPITIIGDDIRHTEADETRLTEDGAYRTA